MSRILIHVITALFIAALFGISGCGSDASTPVATVYSLSKYNSLVTGLLFSFDFNGTDTAGGSYTGSMSVTVDGPVVFETIPTIKRTTTTKFYKVGVVAAVPAPIVSI